MKQFSLTTPRARLADEPNGGYGVLEAHPRILTEVVILVAFVLTGYIAAVWFEAGEMLQDVMERHENWELDEIIVQSLLITICLAIFVVRRMLELRAALVQKTNAELEAQKLARHDPLTGLPNRRQFLGEITKRLAVAPDPVSFAVFLIDIDRFKGVNDLYGHRTGDEVLTVVSERLLDAVGAEGVVARLGGDEFAVLLDLTPDAEQDPLRLAQKLTAVLKEPLAIAGVAIQTGASIGIAIYPGDGNSAGELMHSSDCAMYASKASGRGSYHFFEQKMDSATQERIALEQELDDALRKGEIVPYYQQLVELPSRKIIGYEVLARWIHPIRGVIPPATFIPIAEDSGRLTKLTLSLLRQACTNALEWPGDFLISINVSARQLLERDFPQRFVAVLTQSGFSPERLQIEITENDLIERVSEIKFVLHLFSGLGVKVALDDFGTGYSGLYHLHELHVDVVKIDRSFITNLLSEPEKARIVEAVLGLTHSLGITTTAEGVETQEVSDRLAELGCENVQGFLFGRPKGAEAITAERRVVPARLSLVG